MSIERTIDRTVIGVVACLPLLPAGPAYFGVEPTPCLQVAFIALLALAALSLARRKARLVDPAAAPRPAVFDRISAAWTLFAAASVGAGIVGLAAANDLGSPVFRSNLAEASLLLAPVDRLWNPLYPLKAAVVLVEGAVAYVALRALCLSADDPPRRAEVVFRGWCYGFGLVAVLASAQYITGFGLLPFWVQVNPHLTRSHATLDDPNALGSFMALGTMLLAAVALAGSGRQRVIAGCLALLGCAGVAASASRAAIGGLVLAGLAGTALLSGDHHRSPTRARARVAARLLLAAVAVVIVLSLAARATFDFERAAYEPGNVVEAAISTLDPRIPIGEVSEHRGQWWAAAVAMVRDAPLFGVGLGRFAALLRLYASDEVAIFDAHNFFLQVLAEMGIVGLVALTTLLWAVFATLAELRHGDAPHASTARAALLGSIAFVATFVTGHPLLVPSGQLLWAALLAPVVVLATPAPAGGAAAAATGSAEARNSTGPADKRALPASLAPRILTLCALVVASYAVAAARAPADPAASPWGYNRGLHAEEFGPDGRSFRWTGGEAVLQLRIPNGATSIGVEVVVSPAMRSGRPVVVKISLDRDGSGEDSPDRRDFNVRTVREETSYVVALDLQKDHRFGEYVFLRVEVEPTFVPSRLGPSPDHRELGVRILAPRFAVNQQP